MKKLLIILVAALTLTACTKNARAKEWGGKELVLTPAGEKLINITWKNTDLWILTQDQNGTFHFREHSSFGWMEGEIILNEKP